MSRTGGKKRNTPPLILTFDGKYGGDIYEDWLFEELQSRIEIEKKCEKRRGGFRTLGSLLKLVVAGFRAGNRPVVRPFGMPVFRKKMVVVFHHYDHHGLPWYGRLVELVDMFGLKLTHRMFNTRFLVVSRYWERWLTERGFDVEFRVYNQIQGMITGPDSDTRSYLAKKYGLKYDAKWVFLGGDQPKKGGRDLIQLWGRPETKEDGYQFIFSGRPKAVDFSSDDITVWIDDQDYAGFMSQLHVAVANSRFDEGWCRVAHEAILSNVPVVGSGRGGMAELLCMAGYASNYSELEMVSFIKQPKILLPDMSSRVARLISENNEEQLMRLAAKLDTSVN